jgi:hypothetical protein
MPETSLPVDYIGTLTATLGPPAVIPDGPQGMRVIVPVTGGRFEGPELKGAILPHGGDWVTRRASGTFKLDVRATIQTDDGAAILVTYMGIGHAGSDGNVLRTAPLFETGDPRYAWLNDLQAVGIGRSVPGSVSYDIYRLV